MEFFLEIIVVQETEIINESIVVIFLRDSFLIIVYRIKKIFAE